MTNLLRSLLRIFSTAPKFPNGISTSEKNAVMNFYSSQATHYENSVNVGPLGFFRRREREAILSLANSFAGGKTMIDVGCGAGFYSSQARSAGLHVTAMDISQNMIDAVKHIAHEGIVGDLDRLQVEKKFDYAVCSGVLDFVSHPQNAFENLAKLLSENGQLLVLVPRRSLGGLYYKIEKKIQMGTNVNLYSLAWFKQQAKMHGLEVERVLYPLPTNMAIHFKRVGKSVPSKAA